MSYCGGTRNGRDAHIVIPAKAGIQERTLKERGSAFPRPLYALCFLTFVTLPELRITGRGLVRAKEREIVPLVVE